MSWRQKRGTFGMPGGTPQCTTVQYSSGTECTAAYSAAHTCRLEVLRSSEALSTACRCRRGNTARCTALHCCVHSIMLPIVHSTFVRCTKHIAPCVLHAGHRLVPASSCVLSCVSSIRWCALLAACLNHDTWRVLFQCTALLEKFAPIELELEQRRAVHSDAKQQCAGSATNECTSYEPQPTTCQQCG